MSWRAAHFWLRGLSDARLGKPGWFDWVPEEYRAAYARGYASA